MRIFQTISNNTTLITGLAALTLGATTLTVTAGSAAAQIKTKGSLTVNITGLQNAVGQVCFSLFESRQGFPSDDSAVVAQQCVAAVGESADEMTDSAASESEAPVSVTFEDLALGMYAVSVLHDENEDQQINQGSFGIPTEGFGFSRNPVVQTGAPEFSEAAVFVLGGTTTDIEMIYF